MSLLYLRVDTSTIHSNCSVELLCYFSLNGVIDVRLRGRF